MNWEQVEGQWQGLKGKFKEKWGKLTDDDWTTLGGKKDQIAGKLKEHYGVEKENAEAELDRFIAKLN